VIHLYKDAALTQRISEGDLSNPDDDIYNGTDGESKDRELFIANEQTTLAAGISAVGTTLQTTDPRFSLNQIIIVDNEQMRVTAGAGTTTLTVTRGVNGTTAASHTASTRVYTAASYNSLGIDVFDTSGSSEASWYRLSKTQAGLDTAVPGGQLTLGSKAHNATLSFWRRVTVPAGSAIENKVDLKLRVSGWENAV
jgi:hypothetical protein